MKAWRRRYSIKQFNSKVNIKRSGNARKQSYKDMSESGIDPAIFNYENIMLRIFKETPPIIILTNKL